MKFNKTFLLLLIIPLVSFSVHKYYLSLTQIEFNQKEKSIQVITNVFMDDIEKAINKDYDIDLQLTTKKELKNSDEYFNNYLTKNIAFKVNGEAKNFTYLGKEYEGDIVYFYLEIDSIPEVSTIEITNTVLIKHFPEQQNLVKAKANGKNTSKMLTKKSDKGLLKF